MYHETIGEDDADRRLDCFLRRRLALPRSLAIKLVRRGKARLNGRRVRPEARLAEGDLVEVLDRAVLRPVRAVGAPARGAPSLGAPAEIARRVLFEDRDLLVFDKPSGIVAHAGTGHAGGLVEALRAHLGVPADASFKPSLAHRLDRDTTGIVLVAKTLLALRRLTGAIRRGEVQKRYVALVRGAPDPPDGAIRASVRKQLGPDGRERVEVASGAGAREALTRYRTLGRIDAAPPVGLASLVALELETGRTHQLRVHLAHSGHPIALDRKYGDRAFNEAVKAATGLCRLFLHASEVAFRHPRTDEPLSIEAPLPRDLEAALERIRPGG